TTIRAISNRTRAPRPASAAFCATSLRWARGRSPVSMRCRSAIPNMRRRVHWLPGWSPGSAAMAILSGGRQSAAKFVSIDAMTAIVSSMPWRFASPGGARFSMAKGTAAAWRICYLGSKTGRDGIHGATMASAEFGADAEEKRPTVQVGDPFSEKLLLEACLEIMAKGCVIAIQDMGAAGLTCSAVEMGAKGDLGVAL